MRTGRTSPCPSTSPTQQARSYQRRHRPAPRRCGRMGAGAGAEIPTTRSPGALSGCSGQRGRARRTRGATAAAPAAWMARLHRLVATAQAPRPARRRRARCVRGALRNTAVMSMQSTVDADDAPQKWIAACRPIFLNGHEHYPRPAAGRHGAPRGYATGGGGRAPRDRRADDWPHGQAAAPSVRWPRCAPRRGVGREDARWRSAAARRAE